MLLDELHDYLTSDLAVADLRLFFCFGILFIVGYLFGRVFRLWGCECECAHNCPCCKRSEDDQET